MLWLAGDHHVHTRYSHDGFYGVGEHAENAIRHGLRWLVITDHGGPQHTHLGLEAVHPEVLATRASHPALLIFQGVEWNIPAAEHGTVFVAPHRDEIALLRRFQDGYDATVRRAWRSTPEHEALAVDGLAYLAAARADGTVPDVLMLANHPARNGIDAPYELRDWRDIAPDVAIGMEGAPGHQAATLPRPGRRPLAWRGGYNGGPTSESFAGYPAASYDSYGGFDWMTSTVGGLWDALLAEGRPWSVTANSDSHGVRDEPMLRELLAGRAELQPGHHLPADNDFWPGQYSRTTVGAVRSGYREVMAGMRAGRIWIDHGHLIDGIDVRLSCDDSAVTLGGRLQVRRGDRPVLRIDVRPASVPNDGGSIPRLARIDVVAGAVTGPAADRDGFLAPGTRVVTSSESVTFEYRLPPVEGPSYVRVRGTDGNRSEPGLLGADVDPHGPATDRLVATDPWQDLWFYTNAIFLDVLAD